MKKNLIKAVGLVTIITVIGKILGFGRESVIAAFYGASAQSDVYFVASVIPTILFAAISMAITTGIVPIYIEENKKDKEEAANLISALVTLLLVISIVFIALCIVFAPLITKLVAPGFTWRTTRISDYFNKDHASKLLFFCPILCCNRCVKCESEVFSPSYDYRFRVI